MTNTVREKLSKMGKALLLISSLLLSLFTLSVPARAQRNIPSVIDTVETDNGPVVLYKNFTWEYIDNEPVMMNPEDDSTGIFTHEWINDQVFAHPYLRDSIKDTLVVLVSGDRPFTLPVYGKLFRGFNYVHKGLDIDLNRGDTVKAAFDGVVRYAKYNRGGFGNLVIVRHYNGLETYYAHLSKLKVSSNQIIKSGDLVGFGGSTGRSRAPHLHFELRYHDVPLDPLKVIDFDNKKLISNSLPITRNVFYPADYDGKAVYYKVKSGDTLGRIAKKYHTSVKNLCAMNKVKTTTNLKVGRMLRVK
jgi:murein DD-endopeptidase MepM/ murein hydrolase activator NlpD